MNIEELFEYCLSIREWLPPFDETTVVMKVMEDVAMIPTEPTLSISLKCDP